jgi:hypothetical protein
MDNYTPQTTGARSPAAPKPGTGAGNVPFAPGVMSGNYQSSLNPPLARQMPQAPPSQQQGPPTSAPPGQAPEAAPPQMPPGGGMGGPTPWPMIYVTLLDGYMKAIMESVSKPLIGGMY